MSIQTKKCEECGKVIYINESHICLITRFGFSANQLKLGSIKLAKISRVMSYKVEDFMIKVK